VISVALRNPVSFFSSMATSAAMDELLADHIDGLTCFAADTHARVPQVLIRPHVLRQRWRSWCADRTRSSYSSCSTSCSSSWIKTRLPRYNNDRAELAIFVLTDTFIF
jgi:hypothetical protein